MTALLLATLGLLAGGLGALMGIGGGIIVVPALSAGLGLPFRQAAAVSLVVIIASSSASAATYMDRKLSDRRVGVVLELATVAGALAGSALAGVVSPAALKVLFACVATYSAAVMWRRGRGAPEPDVTSYDYDAPIDEAGRPTPKFQAIRALFAEFLQSGENLPDIPPAPAVIAVPEIRFTESAAVFEHLGRARQDEHVLADEEVGLVAAEKKSNDVAKIAIDTLQVIDGSLPKRALGLVLDWASLHQQELRQAFDRAAALQPPGKIAPLE